MTLTSSEYGFSNKLTKCDYVVVKNHELHAKKLEIVFLSFHISKFSGGACPQTSLVGGGGGGAYGTSICHSRLLKVWQMTTSNPIENPAKWEHYLYTSLYITFTQQYWHYFACEFAT